MEQAIIENDIEKVELLLKDSNFDPSYCDIFSINYACKNGFTEIVKLLLEDSRFNPSNNNSYSIIFASGNGHTEIVKLLLKDSRADPSIDDNYPIKKADIDDYTEIVKLLLKDSRVKSKWRMLTHNMVKDLFKKKEEKMEKELFDIYESIEKISPKITFVEDGIVKEGAAMPRNIIQKIVYETKYSEICADLEGNVPPIKLITLGNILKIEYDMYKINTKKLCEKIDLKLI